MKQDSIKVQVVNVNQKLALFSDHWSPKIIGEMNNDKIQAVKLKGPFEWHHHEKEDELFYVIKGNLIIHFRDRDLHIIPGEFVIIPHLLEHKPEAPEEVEILLIEPKEAVNTGNVTSDKAVKNQDKI